MYRRLENKIDRLFNEAADRFEQVRQNPVTGSRWVAVIDSIKPQKQVALKAHLAREWFAMTGPEGAPPLPLSYEERESLKDGGLSHIVAWFAESLRALHYDVYLHPPFARYARGVLASPYAPDFIKKNKQLTQDFPPSPLPSSEPANSGPICPKARPGFRGKQLKPIVH
jgi:hypothetical protein